LCYQPVLSSTKGHSQLIEYDDWLQAEGRMFVVRFSAGLDNLSLLQSIRTGFVNQSASYP